MSLEMLDNSTSPRRSSRLEVKQNSPRSSSSDASMKENTILRLELSPDSATPTRDTIAHKSFETPSTHPQCVLISRKNILHSGLDSEGESPKSLTSTPPKNNLRKYPSYSPKYSPRSSPRWQHRFRKALAEVALEESNRTPFETGSFYGRKAEKKSAFELKLAASQLGLPTRSPSLSSVNQLIAKKSLSKKHMPSTSRSSVKHRSAGAQSSKKIKTSSVKKLSSAKKPLPSSSRETLKSVGQETTNTTSTSTNTTPSPPRVKRKFFSRSTALRSPSKRPRSAFKLGNHNVSIQASKYSPKRKCLSPSSSSPGSPQKIRTSPRRLKPSPRSSSLPSSPLSDPHIAPQNLDFTNDFETSFSTTNSIEMQGTGLFEEPPHNDMETDQDVKAGNTSSKKERTASQKSLSESTNPKGKDLFPIFFCQRSNSSNTPSPKTPSTTPRTSKFVTPRRSRLRSTKKDNLEQLIIDVGQKEVAAFQCETCGMYYTPCDEEDNITHTRYHNILQTNLKFSGWKKEKVVAEFHDGRIIHIKPDHPRYAQQKVKEVRDVVDEELGFAESDAHKGKNYHAFLFIADKKVVGCVLAETISAAFRIIDDPSNSSLCCSETSEKALCGISRIWTLKTRRKNKIASRLMESVRSHFLFGYVMSKDEIAFSVPTQDGQKFAASYTSTNTFLVYK